MDYPLEKFNYFLDDGIKQLIIEESKIYAKQNGVIFYLSIEELNAFFGMLITMGFHNLPSMRMYWCSDTNLNVPRIANVMSQKRFLKTFRYVHINDNDKMPKKGEAIFDKLYKIRPLIDHLNSRFRNRFNLSMNLDRDESMVGFKGRTLH